MQRISGHYRDVFKMMLGLGGLTRLRSIKFIYCEKVTKFFEIFILLLSVCTVVKSKVKILQNCVAFSEYMNSIN